MAIFTSDPITTGTYVRAQIVVDEISRSNTNLTTEILVYVRMWRTNTGYTTADSGTLYIKATGYDWEESSILSSQEVTYNSYTTVGRSSSFRITHNSNGSKTITVTVKSTSHTANLVIPETDFEITLTPFDVEPPVVSQTISSITANGFRLGISSSTNADRFEYRLDSDEPWQDAGVASETYTSVTFRSLTPNTTYHVKSRARRASNGVYGYSATTTVKTLGASRINWANETTVYVDEPTVEFGFKLTVYDASFYHRLSVLYNDDPLLVRSGIQYTAGEAVRTVTLTSAERESILQGLSEKQAVEVTYKIETFYDEACTNQVGDASLMNRVVFRTSAERSAPIFADFSYFDGEYNVTTVTGDDQVLVQLVSRLIVNCTPGTARNGATIRRYSVSLGERTPTSSSTTVIYGNIQKSGMMTLSVSCTDSRGYVTTVEKEITVIPYEAPKINTYRIRRRNEVEDLVQLQFSGTFSPIVVNGEGVNHITYVAFAYKQTDGTEWSEEVPITDSVSAGGSNFSFNSDELIELSAEKSYSVRLIVKDRFYGRTALGMDITLTSGIPLVALRKRTSAYPFPRVGINNPDPQEALDVSGNINMNGFHVQGFVRMLDGESLNAADKAGIYGCVAPGEGENLRYPTNSAGIMEVLQAGSLLIQRFTAVSGEVFARSKNGYTWTDWA